ncbi:hypothetical protein G5V57_20390 [Nordella sp. HKS 07]|uniref:hypothetical protein n=1 Tax=Nordella sp. HKS 07 TaxID=2712222 RepID=UPI0013E150CC|nr:hypothetical protein [Nordella sp. HKS 07]QIG49873.1 hypothetical protein G5V57_20390 [Nordella sp. HKS 07]
MHGIAEDGQADRDDAKSRAVEEKVKVVTSCFTDGVQREGEAGRRDQGAKAKAAEKGRRQHCGYEDQELDVFAKEPGGENLQDCGER